MYGRNCSSTIRQPKFPVELLFCSYFIFNSLFNHRPFFSICPLKNSGINSILPNKRVGFKANSSLVYWVYQSLSYEKTWYSLYNLSRNHSCFVSALPRLHSTSSVCLIDNHFYHLKLILIIPRLWTVHTNCIIRLAATLT